MSETWALNGVVVTSGAFTMLSLNVDPPKAKPDWVGAADSETDVLFRQPFYEKRTITWKLLAQAKPTMDQALDQVGLLVDQLVACSAFPRGLPLTWSPANSARTVTFRCLHGEITGLPISLQDEGVMWFGGRPIVTVELTCEPYWTGVPLPPLTVAGYTSLANDYTVDGGSLANVTSGTTLGVTANPSVEERFAYTSFPYRTAAAQLTLAHTLGTTVTGYKAGVLLKRLDASNYLEAYVDDNGTNSRLRVDVVVAGTRTNLSSTNLAARMAVSTAYWVRGRIEGNLVTAEHWTASPTVTGTATLSAAVTITAGTATQFGSGVLGRTGFSWIPIQAAATLGGLTVEPNMFITKTPFVAGEVSGVPGDAPALATLIVTDAAGQGRRHIEFGVEGPLTYNSATSLLIDSDDMTGLSGVQATTTGAYDPNACGNNSITMTPIANATTAMAATADPLSHVGPFRIKLRVQSGSLLNLFRLAWKAGDGPTNHNDWTSPVSTAGWQELDLGTIIVPRATFGTQRWTGQIEVLGGAGFPGTVALDYSILVPQANGYGKARAATSSDTTGILTAYDAFAGTTAGGALNTRTAPLGGAWVTSGAATDFAFSDTPVFLGATQETVKRTATGTRFAVLGTATPTDVQVKADIGMDIGSDIAGLIARWVDSSNYAAAQLNQNTQVISIVIVVAGSTTVIDNMSIPSSHSGSLQVGVTLSFIVFASGRVNLTVTDSSGVVFATIDTLSSVLATGGALASGKSGIIDAAASAGPGRYWTTFSASIPRSEPTVIYSGRSLQWRYDTTERQDSTGAYYGHPPNGYRGSRFLLQPGTSRVLVKARRNDIEAAVDDQVLDATQAQVVWTPRGLVIPRQ